MNDVFFDTKQRQFKLNIEYNYGEHQFNIQMIDLRPVAERMGSVANMYLVSDEDLLTETWGGEALTTNEIHSKSQTIKLLTTTLITTNTPLGEYVKYTILDLHTTRSL